MYKEILKFGANIVDALVDYRQPVFVYIIGELRGGAWVVLDPKINPDMMEMYAETNSRGGVLEPEGLVEIKFRKPQLLATMERLDPKYRALRQQLQDPATTNDEKKALIAALAARERELMPVYHSAAISFADLHDGPKRMMAKGVINKIVDWEHSRKFFYTRLLRRISEERIFAQISEADSSISRDSARILMAQWFFVDTQRAVVPSEKLSARNTSPSTSAFDSGMIEEYLKSDLDVVRWLNEMKNTVDERVLLLKKGALQRQLSTLVGMDLQVAISGIVDGLKNLDENYRREVLESIAKALE